MRRRFVSLLALLALVASPALAGDYAAGPIKIASPWTRVPPPGAKVAAGFLSITNTGTEADRLLGGSVAIADRLEVHEMKMANGVMSMRALEDGLAIKPGETVVLQPGSTHLMFQELSTPPEAGKPVKGSLQFEKAGSIDIEYTVAPFGAKSANDTGTANPNTNTGTGHGHH